MGVVDGVEGFVGLVPFVGPTAVVVHAALVVVIDPFCGVT